jgi:hypothetical protein
MNVCIEPAGAERNGKLKIGHLSILALLFGIFALPWQEKHQYEIEQERSIELKIGPTPSTFILMKTIVMLGKPIEQSRLRMFFACRS